MIRALLIMATLAAVAAVPATAGSSDKVAAQLVGSWSRMVTAADWRRVGKPGGNTGRYSISIAANGHFALGRILGTISAASGYHRVTIGGVCRSAKGVFSWNIAGPKLTLAKVHDRCAEADGLLVGVWTRY